MTDKSHSRSMSNWKGHPIGFYPKKTLQRSDNLTKGDPYMIELQKQLRQQHC